jgi:DNA repair exonuclease SbcCD nuclease subunit
VPVFIVPGNHERSRLPHARLVAHPRVRVFDRPRTFTMEVGGTDVALSGFPFERRAVRGRVLELLEASGWRSEPASLRLLCMHQCVEGATVGPADYTFRTAPDVVCAAELPAGFSAVLSGHIHRHQVLTTDLRGRPLSTPVLYPGSIERTSLAELGEPKGFLLLHLTDRNPEGNLHWTFRPLPARPMIVQDIRVAAGRGARLDQAVRAAIAAAPADAVLRIRLSGELLPRDLRLVSAARLRTIAPATMNVEVTAGTWPIRSAQAVRSRQSRAARASTPADPQLQPLLWAGD